MGANDICGYRQERKGTQNGMVIKTILVLNFEALVGYSKALKENSKRISEDTGKSQNAYIHI